jgi:hypothetical protein
METSQTFPIFTELTLSEEGSLSGGGSITAIGGDGGRGGDAITGVGGCGVSGGDAIGGVGGRGGDAIAEVGGIAIGEPGRDGNVCIVDPEDD